MNKRVLILIIIFLIIASVWLFQDEIEEWYLQNINPPAGGSETDSDEYSQAKNQTANDMLQNNYTETDATNALQSILTGFGAPIANRIEQIYRLETNNFKSSQYAQTGTAGMVVNSAWPEREGIRPDEYPTVIIDGTNYYIFPSVVFAMEYLAYYLQKYGLDAGTQRWGGTSGYLATVQKQDTSLTT